MLERGVYFAPSAFEAGFVSAAHAGEALQYTLDALPSGFSRVAERSEAKLIVDLDT